MAERQTGNKSNSIEKSGQQTGKPKPTSTTVHITSGSIIVKVSCGEGSK